jgi:hypothetical protein
MEKNGLNRKPFSISNGISRKKTGKAETIWGRSFEKVFPVDVLEKEKSGSKIDLPAAPMGWHNLFFPICFPFRRPKAP